MKTVKNCSRLEFEFRVDCILEGQSHAVDKTIKSPDSVQIPPTSPKSFLSQAYPCSAPHLTSTLPLVDTPARTAGLTIMTPCSPTPKKILVFGSGNFGSCLADHLGDSEHEVSMWSREKSFVEYFQ
jgi:hypothetical protein